jgi:hypothetical protein
MTMPATVRSLPSNETQEIIDFLRRLASMMTGGRNAEMLLEAASAIETLSRRVASTEALLKDQQDEHARNLEQREVAELAADNLLTEVAALKEHLARTESHAAAGIAALKTEIADKEQRAEAEIASHKMQLAEHQQQAEADREHADAEIASLQGRLVEKDAHAQQKIAALTAEVEQRDRLAEIDRRVFAEETERLKALTEGRADPAGIDESVAVVSVQALQLARTQFGYLAKAFEQNGDVISLTMCEIGAQALNKALAGTKP